MSKLSQIVNQLLACNYECEAGKLEHNLAFQELMELAAKEQSEEPPMITSDTHFKVTEVSPGIMILRNED